MEVISRQDAISQGLKRYYTGKQCKYGHVFERHVCDCKCIGCQSEKQNTESHKKYMKNYKETYNKETKEHRLSYSKTYREENLEKEKIRLKKYRQENKEKIREYVELNRKKVNQYSLDYYYRNKHKIVANVRKRQTRLKQALPSWFEQEKDLIQDVYKKREELSMLTETEYHVDHIIPIANDLVCGLHCLANLRIISATENLRKNNKFEVGEY